MMKFYFSIVMMMILVKFNLQVSFMYNLCFFLSFIFMFNYYFPMDFQWTSLSLYSGMDIYSFFLILLTLWVVGLMFMSLELMSLKIKLFLFLSLMFVLVGAFSSSGLMLFYVFFEVSLIPTFILVVMWGANSERVSAAYYLLMYTLFISLPLLVYVFILFNYVGSFNFILMSMNMSVNNLGVGMWGYILIFTAFFIKMPLFMFHVWLPKAHVEAPVYGSMILAAVLLKLGGYGLYRLLLIFMEICLLYNYMIYSVAIVGGVLTGLICLVQIDMKSLVAYSSVVHMNMLMCSIMTMMKFGLMSSYIMMVAHGLCSSGLFYMVNFYYARSSSRLLLMNKGMINMIPSAGIWWFFLCASNFSFPLSLNFPGEIFMLMVLMSWEIGLMIYWMLICFISSAYSLYLFSYVQHGEVFNLKIFNSGLLKELMIMILHFFPLIILLLNLMFFY